MSFFNKYFLNVNKCFFICENIDLGKHTLQDKKFPSREKPQNISIRKAMLRKMRGVLGPSMFDNHFTLILRYSSKRYSMFWIIL